MTCMRLDIIRKFEFITKFNVESLQNLTKEGHYYAMN